MDLKERIYNIAPQPLQRLAVNIYANRLYNRRYSSDYFRLFEQVKFRDRISKDEMTALQINRLRKSLHIAVQNTEYFKELFSNHGFDPMSIRYPEDINCLPIQTKADINRSGEGIFHRDYKNISHQMIHTSGTTGSGLIYPESLNCEREKWSVWWRFRGTRGLKVGMWLAHFGGRTIVPVKQSEPPFWKEAAATRQVFFSFYHLNPDTAKDYVGELKRRKMQWINGNPSTLSYLASLMIDQGLSFDGIVKYVTTGAETLMSHQKKLITEGFGIKPVEMYGLTEPVANISECEYGKLHVDEDYSFVEFIPIGDVQNQYKIIGTSFANETLQFLRYDTNDVAVISDPQVRCQCGRQSRVVDRIDGRMEDFVTLKDGSKIRGLHYIFKDTVNIKEAQIVQDETGRVAFHIVRGDYYSEKDEKKLITEINLRLRSTEFLINYLPAIPRTKNGKLRFVISSYKGRGDLSRKVAVGKAAVGKVVQPLKAHLESQKVLAEN